MRIRLEVSNVLIIFGVICFLFFGVVSFGVFTESDHIEKIDLMIIEAIQANITDAKTTLFSIFTEIGNIRLIIALTIAFVIFFFIKRWYVAGLWLGGTILCFAAIGTKLIKLVIDRTRPDILPLIEKTTESFPSGHATSAAMFYGMLGLVLILMVKKYWKKAVIGLAVLLLIGFIMITRVYLGVHFPTDVIGGFLYGMATAFISVGVYQYALEPLQRLLQHLKIQDQSMKVGHKVNSRLSQSK
ncbi:phosphatase PAP2 family protein [Oceanobacillus sp. FSL H7-0719]|uniref:phosphatase PAP2 family protein n=1 Tax=Oceanobacillus sp. FSL H7-0719 TaxID=2954507 RepID=UPI0032534A33